MIKPFFFLLAFLYLTCSSSMPTYQYADGNGNRYTIMPSQLSYDPVKVGESSSGFYSGGVPQTVSLRKEQYEEIKAALERAIGNPAKHISDRLKGSGAIVDPNQKKYLLAPGSAEMTELESFLRQALQARQR